MFDQEFLKSLQVGDDVAVSTRLGYYRRKIERMTKTMFILDSGDRYKRESGFSVRRSSWDIDMLLDIKAERVVKGLQKQALENMSTKTILAAEAFRKEPSKENYEKLESLVKRLPTYMPEEESNNDA